MLCIFTGLSARDPLFSAPVIGGDLRRNIHGYSPKDYTIHSVLDMGSEQIVYGLESIGKMTWQSVSSSKTSVLSSISEPRCLSTIDRPPLSNLSASAAFACMTPLYVAARRAVGCQFSILQTFTTADGSATWGWGYWKEVPCIYFHGRRQNFVPVEIGWAIPFDSNMDKIDVWTTHPESMRSKMEDWFEGNVNLVIHEDSYRPEGWYEPGDHSGDLRFSRPWDKLY